MDDYRRSLYMMAQNRIRSAEGHQYICITLKVILYLEGYGPIIGDKVLEFFPELLALYDGVYWCEDGINEDEKPSITAPWWEYGWQEPRIRALDCILWE
jgi:hypothetical protein